MNYKHCKGRLVKATENCEEYDIDHNHFSQLKLCQNAIKNNLTRKTSITT